MTTASDGSWTPGIGDPSLIGWVTVAAYCGTALLALHCAQLSRARNAQLGPASSGRHASATGRLVSIWTGIALLFLALGVNKQLDLQSLFTLLARRIVVAEGLYENRRRYQQLFIAALALSAALGLLGAASLLRRELRLVWPALLGSVFVVLFVLVRASSFHHVDFLLAATVGGWRLNWIFELGGIGLVALAALKFAYRERRRR